ncbi:MAG: cpdA 2 [Burkholderiales bacterium]|jgi:hypothetical protein|nr:cpdA 2 [Burkholderiales bacterium]
MKIKQFVFITGMVTSLFSCLNVAQAETPHGTCTFSVDGHVLPQLTNYPDAHTLLSNICTDKVNLTGCTIPWERADDKSRVDVYFNNEKYGTSIPDFSVYDDNLIFAKIAAHGYELRIQQNEANSKYTINFPIELTKEGSCQETIKPGEQNILQLTDIHFNPFAECTANVKPCKVIGSLIANDIHKWSTLLSSGAINNYKEETNNAFLTHGFDKLAEIVVRKGVKTILISGDTLAHDFDTNYKNFAPSQYTTNTAYFSDFCVKTLLYVVLELEKRVPAGTKIYVTLGNNDSDIKNYKMQSHNFLSKVAAGLSKYVDSNSINSFTTSYDKGGYFSVPLSDKITLIGLNTNSFSPDTTATGDITASNAQLNWFTNELVTAEKNGKKVILTQHIPYGMNLYFAAKNNIAFSALDDKLEVGYFNQLKQHYPVISSIYAGHFHGEFLSLIDGKIPVIGTIAFNSYFGNNPGFKVIHISPEGNFDGYTTYFFSQATNAPMAWTPLYDYGSTYGSPDMIVYTLQNFPYDLKDPKVFNYRTYYAGGYGASTGLITEDQYWKAYYCGIKYSESPAYTACIK